MDKKIKRLKDAQLPTSCIVHLADSANFKGVTSNKLFSGLTVSYFESPNDTIHVAVWHTDSTLSKQHIHTK